MFPLLNDDIAKTRRDDALQHAAAAHLAREVTRAHRQRAADRVRRAQSSTDAPPARWRRALARRFVAAGLGLLRMCEDPLRWIAQHEHPEAAAR
jgi:hypothetical protein